jgi:tRNA(Arg) A34 adenosine deaminase TadA
MNVKLQNRCVSIARAMTPTIRSMRNTHVSFLIKKGKIVHIGWNKYKSHPINLSHPYHSGFVALHAEMDVILKANKEWLSGYNLVVVRLNGLGQITNSRPCSGCQSIINQVGINKCWFTNSNGGFEALT